MAVFQPAGLNPEYVKTVLNDNTSGREVLEVKPIIHNHWNDKKKKHEQHTVLAFAIKLNLPDPKEAKQAVADLMAEYDTYLNRDSDYSKPYKGSGHWEEMSFELIGEEMGADVASMGHNQSGLIDFYDVHDPLDMQPKKKGRSMSESQVKEK